MGLGDKMDIESLCKEIKEDIRGLKTEFRAVSTKVNLIDAALIGYDGKAGLIDSHEELQDDHNKLKLLVYLVVGSLIGSGALVGGWSFGLI